jgi:putative tryptophan/tyrosine transport system substrate-binding protein
MAKNIFFIIVFLLLSASPCFAADRVLSIQSLPVKPYDRAVDGFTATTRIKPDRLILSENKGVDIRRKVMRKQPDLVLAVGMGALKKVLPMDRVPVLYLMVLNPPTMVSGRKNITGVSMQVAPEIQIDLFEKISGDIDHIGLIYNPENSGVFVDEALQLAKKSRLVLTAVAVDDPRDVPAALNGLKGRIDAFWMLPDISVVTGETVEFLLLFSLENKIPVLTFSEKYVGMGALLSVGMDPYDMGMQAGDMAKRILDGAKMPSVTPEYARKPVISINEKIGKKLDIRINPDSTDNPLPYKMKPQRKTK